MAASFTTNTSASTSTSTSITSSPLRVLCFGDSLTSGFCDFGLTEHPYSIALQKRLSAALPDRNPQVFTNGVPGDVAFGPGFKRRLTNEFERRPYDWVIVLAGTNDLATRFPVSKIYEALSGAWDIALRKGTKVLALTVPECRTMVSWLDDDRDELNCSIRNHYAVNFHSFDLRSKIPFHALSQEDRRKYWDDGLHLKPAGYDWMGNHIADALLQILAPNSSASESASASESQQQPPAATKTEPTAAKRDGDEAALDEEAGNPKNISQGYVVVRKRDLD